MPEQYTRSHRHPFNPGRAIAAAAHDGQIITYKCNLCRRSRSFLASDLVKILPADTPVDSRPFKCSQCGLKDYIQVNISLPDIQDYGNLIIRRLVGIRAVPTWKDKKLGDP